ncbi:MAG: response regulator [Candidatus Omnitrophica bacterium]|nr:response regulator [Candidatus Omnitrophota bacterium]
MSYKILVVDDDPVDVRLIQAILMARGYQATTAVDGCEALAKIRSENPHLVVLDVMMPEANGYDVCYELRFNDEFQKIPILILTLREQEIDEEIATRLHMKYLPKPVDANLLVESIEGLLSGTKA